MNTKQKIPAQLDLEAAAQINAIANQYHCDTLSIFLVFSHMAIDHGQSFKQTVNQQYHQMQKGEDLSIQFRKYSSS